MAPDFGLVANALPESVGGGGERSAVTGVLIAEELGVRPETIEIENADTGTTPFATPSGGSFYTYARLSLSPDGQMVAGTPIYRATAGGQTLAHPVEVGSLTARRMIPRVTLPREKIPRASNRPTRRISRR